MNNLITGWLLLNSVMKKALSIIFFTFCTLQIFASHIVGGEVYYRYLGPGSAGKSKYTVGLRLFTECDQVCGSGVACPPTDATLGIFINISPYNLALQISLPLVDQPLINLTTYPPCLDLQPKVCYKINNYSAIVELADNAQGYRIAYQSCCRASSFNVNSDASTTSGVPGATYEATMPGTNLLATGHNSTALVRLKDTALVCYKSPFSLAFTAVDPDGDRLTYEFTSAYNGGRFTSAQEAIPDAPLYGVVNYGPGYSGTSPLGSQVTINNSTGIISGIAPANVGKYVVNVVIKEWRNNIMIAEHRKDFLVRTNECTISKASLTIIPTSCDGYSVDFSQYNNSVGNITDFQWIFGDPASGSLDTSLLPGPIHVYSAAGTYTVRLKVSINGICVDSTSSEVKVYPGFFPGFTENSPICKEKPLQFTDITTANFGSVNSWTWNFGDAGSSSNSSNLQNPNHIYLNAGTYNSSLIVGSDKGCIDTVNKIISIVEKPVFSIGNDTLICSIDTLQLNAVASSPGIISWSPNYNIDNVNSFSPLVSPDITTTYLATFIDNSGCTGTESIKISVVDFVTLSAGNDTTICRTDAIILRPNSDGLYYLWTPAATLNDPNIKNPVAIPTDPITTYHVRASIGKCVADDEIIIKTVPYPDADAGADTLICFGKSAQLHASGGSIYTWSPTAFLNAANIPNPVSVNPIASVVYVVTVRDLLGCPKPVNDTIIVNVAKIIANAGPRDTSVVSGQPLQLFATGSNIYLWTPDTWLNNPNIASPVSLPLDNIQYVVRVSNSIGCFSTDTINVLLYKVKPDLFVPTGFSPNGDGTNDILRPLALGLKSVNTFRVYNRWGQLLFATSQIGAGWDGTFKGAIQEAGTYVWFAEGTDYSNNILKRKGTVVLIR